MQVQRETCDYTPEQETNPTVQANVSVSPNIILQSEQASLLTLFCAETIPAPKSQLQSK